MKKKAREKKRLMVAVPIEAKEKIETVRADLSRRSGRTLTAGQALLVALGLAARVVGSRAYLMSEGDIVKLVSREVPDVAAKVVRAITGQIVTFSTAENGVTTFFLNDDKQTAVVSAVLPSLTEYELN